MTDAGFDDLSRADTGATKVDQVREGAAHAAHDMRDELSDAAADVKGQTTEQLAHVKDEVMSHASDLVGQTRQQVVSQADQGTHQLAETLVAAGRELGSMAERSEQSDGPMTALVRQIGQRATSMGERFQEGGYRALKDDLTGYARSSPGMFLLASAAAGFMVGRVVRNADTHALADAARGDSGGGSEAVGPAGGAASSVMDRTSAIPREVDLREPPGVGADELTGLIAGGAAPSGADPAFPAGEVR